MCVGGDEALFSELCQLQADTTHRDKSRKSHPQNFPSVEDGGESPKTQQEAGFQVNSCCCEKNTLIKTLGCSLSLKKSERGT